MSTSKKLPSKMPPGFYVLRLPVRGSGSRLYVESRCFPILPDVPREWSRRQADYWRDYISSEHPDDEVFVVEREPEEED
jgi:hypothetical protein